MISEVKVVCAAHRGEINPLCQALRATPFSLRGVPFAAKTDSLILVVTGEGLFATTAALSAAMAQVSEVTLVINIGVAASANSAIGPGDIRAIGCAYGQETDLSIQYSSYPCQPILANSLPTANCVSAAKRIFTIEAARDLANFAPLIDRELWAVGNVAKRFGLPFSAIKVVSDEVGATRCQEIFDQAALFGEALRDAVWPLVSETAPAPEQPKDDLDFPNGFHATKSQRDRFRRLRRQLAIKLCVGQNAIDELLVSSLQVDTLQQRGLKPKEKTEHLLRQMEQRLSPYRARFEDALRRLSMPLTSAGLRPTFSTEFEEEAFRLELKLGDTSDWQRCRRALDAFDFDGYLALVRGEGDIEI